MLLHRAFIYHAHLAFAFIYHAFIYHTHPYSLSCLSYSPIKHSQETPFESLRAQFGITTWLTGHGSCDLVMWDVGFVLFHSFQIGAAPFHICSTSLVFHPLVKVCL